MASFSTKEKNKIDNDNPTFLGQLKRIPKEDFLLSLSKGKYLLQSWKIVRLNKTISDHYFPELSLNGRHKQHFSLAEKETEQELLGTIAKLMEGINDRIDQLIGVPGGGDDPLLEEMYQSVDRLLTAGYDHYVQVRPDFFCESNRERMLIVVDKPHSGLLYDKKVIDEVVSSVEPVSKSSNNEEGRLSALAAPNDMPACFVKLKRLETFIPKQQMDMKWQLYRKSVQKKMRDKMRKKTILGKAAKLKTGG